jgi:hypothetical protein
MVASRTKRAAGLVVACAGFLAAGWLWNAWRTAEAGEPSPEAVATDGSGPPQPAALRSGGDQPAFEATREAARPRPSAPLPGALSPAELVERLLPRARAGDAAAGCRLAYELADCRSARQWRSPPAEVLERELLRAESEDVEQLKSAERQLAWYAWQEQRKNECEALPAAIRDAGPKLMFQAAQQGSRTAMVGYASLRGVGGQQIVADPALYAQYRQHAFPMWRQAFESGSVDALQVWVSALQSNGFQFFAGVLPEEYQDLDLAQALTRELQTELRLEGETLPGFPRVEAAVDPQTARRARELFDRHFRNSPSLAAARERMVEYQRLQEAQRAAPMLPNEQWEHRVKSFNALCGAD